MSGKYGGINPQPQRLPPHTQPLLRRQHLQKHRQWRHCGSYLFNHKPILKK
jgi:hypothetical protein